MIYIYIYKWNADINRECKVTLRKGEIMEGIECREKCVIWYCLRLPHVEVEDMETPKVQIQQWFHFFETQIGRMPPFQLAVDVSADQLFLFLTSWLENYDFPWFRQLQVPREGKAFATEFSHFSISFSLPPKIEEDPPQKKSKMVCQSMVGRRPFFTFWVGGSYLK